MLGLLANLLKIDFINNGKGFTGLDSSRSLRGKMNGPKICGTDFKLPSSSTSSLSSIFSVGC